MRKTIFISDLHLSENSSEINQQLTRFLTKFDASVDALYLLGDLFEYWVGNNQAFAAQLVKRLFSELHMHGIPLYFVRGNRDFLVDKIFCHSIHCQLLKDITVVNLYGKEAIILHGDLLCTHDQAYLRMRKIFHNKFLQKAFLCLPLQVREKIATALRQKSQQNFREASFDKMDVAHEAVIELMHKHQVNTIIHGHTHKTAIHQHAIGERIVLSDWGRHSNALIWYQNGKKALVAIDEFN